MRLRLAHLYGKDSLTTPQLFYLAHHLWSINLLASSPKLIHSIIGTIAITIVITIAIMPAIRLTAADRYPSDVMAMSSIPAFVIA